MEHYCSMQGNNGMPERLVETWRNFQFYSGNAGSKDAGRKDAARKDVGGLSNTSWDLEVAGYQVRRQGGS